MAGKFATSTSPVAHRRRVLALVAALSLSAPLWAAGPSTQASQGKKNMSAPQVELHIKDYGVVTLELDAVKAPKSTENFLSYVKSGFYDGTIFHRVINNFMIQGGGFTAGMKQKSTQAPIQNEANNGLKNDVYTIAMARTNDPHSATAQFFINVTNNEFLNHRAPSAQGWGYAVFGKVVKGTEIVDKIKGVKTGNSGFHGDVPLQDVTIEKAVAL